MASAVSSELTAGLASGILTRANVIAYEDTGSGSSVMLKTKIAALEAAIQSAGSGGGSTVTYDSETGYIQVDGVNLVQIPPTTPLPSGLLSLKGFVTIGTVEDETTHEERDQTLEEALAAIQSPSVGDVYLYWNETESQVEEYVYVEVETEVEEGGVTTTQTVGQWSLMGIQQDSLNVEAQLIDGSEDEYELTIG